MSRAEDAFKLEKEGKKLLSTIRVKDEEEERTTSSKLRSMGSRFLEIWASERRVIGSPTSSRNG